MSDNANLPKLIKRIKGQRYTLHDQNIFFKSGHKRIVKGVIHIWQNTWTHLGTKNEQEWIINDNEVECIQRYISEEDKD